MKILVLNGSPKGRFSITEQYVRFVEKKRPDLDFDYERVAHRIRTLEKNQEAFAALIDKVRQADLVVWAFPLYYLLVSSQYKRFIELLFEREVTDAFKDKPAVSLSTSIHFYDHTAHDYMRSICEDLGMQFLGFHSPDMVDLTEEEGQASVVAFFHRTLAAVQAGVTPGRVHAPLQWSPWAYTPSSSSSHSTPSRPSSVPNLEGQKMVILTDLRSQDPDQPGDKNLSAMVDRLVASVAGDVEVHSLHDLDIKGGCLGCCRCALDWRCVYTGKDGYIDFFKNALEPADILVFAGAIHDRYLSSKWKQFFDRSFFNNHTPALRKKQVGFLISGPLCLVPNLRRIMESYIEFQESNLVDMVSDESRDSSILDRQIEGLAQRLVGGAQLGHINPKTFLGVGGMKVFRDAMFEGLKAVFQADHRAYKKRGYYDLPHRQYGSRAKSALFSMALHLPPVRKRFPDMIKPKMVEPLRKIVEKA